MIADGGSTLRQRTGAALLDLPNLLWGLRPSLWRSRAGPPWLHVRNRGERVVMGPDKEGVRCDWQWTSTLHVARVFPWAGTLLMRRALREWPIAFCDTPAPFDGVPDVSFLIGHRGLERAPLLLATLGSIAAQQNVTLECIVVEQADDPAVRDLLPAWVRYRHTPLAAPGLPYCRSWAFNVAAREARGRLLVFHDNDMVVPRGYAAELLRQASRGFEVLNLKRFIFYMPPEYAEQLVKSGRALVGTPESVIQNAEAGGSVAATPEAFDGIGGFDESFVGWGGEDNEFWERVQARRVYPHGYLPIVHLWHRPQPLKASATNQTYLRLSGVPADERIAALRARPRGSLDGPWAGRR